MRTNSSITVNLMSKNDRKKEHDYGIAILSPVVMIQYYINETENPAE